MKIRILSIDRDMKIPEGPIPLESAISEYLNRNLRAVFSYSGKLYEIRIRRIKVVDE